MGATGSKSSSLSSSPRRSKSSGMAAVSPRRSKSSGMAAVRLCTAGKPRTSARGYTPPSPMDKKLADDDVQSQASTKAEFSVTNSQSLSGVDSISFSGTHSHTSRWGVDSISFSGTQSHTSRCVADLDEMMSFREVDSGSSAGARPTTRMPKLIQPSPRASAVSASSAGLREVAAQTSDGSKGPQKHLNFGQFRMIRTVGVGFMGSVRVVKRTDTSDETPYALKIMKKTEVIKRKQVEHCNSERQLLSQVEHPFIVRLHGTFQDESHLFMLMEFVNGGELFSAIRHSNKLENDGAKFYAAELILALDYLHGKDIAFRDLKPENVLLDFQGHAKITDFGFAKVVPKRTWTMCGTPEYLAPEIIKVAGHGPCVDWWALGIIIYEMLCGHAPFRGNKSSEIYEKVLHTEPKYPYHITGNAKNLIEKLLVRDPCRRLGGGAQGAKEIKNHAWFYMVDWDMVLRKRYQPPFVPSVKDKSDSSRFDKYPEQEVDVDSPSDVPKEMQQLFKNF